MPHNLQELCAVNLGVVTFEILRHQELIDWGLTAAGSATLIIYNLIRIVRMLRNQQAKSEQPKKKGKGKG